MNVIPGLVLDVVESILRSANLLLSLSFSDGLEAIVQAMISSNGAQ